MPSIPQKNKFPVNSAKSQLEFLARKRKDCEKYEPLWKRLENEVPWSVAVPEFLEEDFEPLMKEGKLFGKTDFMVEWRPCGCHENSLSGFAATNGISRKEFSKYASLGLSKLRIFTGYGLADHGTWHQHSWLATEDGRVVETTSPRIAYYGVELSGLRLASFAEGQDFPKIVDAVIKGKV